MMASGNERMQMDIDSMIERLLSPVGAHRASATEDIIQISLEEINVLCDRAKEIFLSQPVLLELQAPTNICGNIHGQYADLLGHFDQGGLPPQSNYLFLGSYVDRGKQSLETICLLLAYKIKYPNNIHLLRGNHECASMTRVYGFYNECKRRHNIKLWKAFIACFNCLPVAAIINEKIFCCHGGLSPDLSNLDQIRRIQRPTDVPDAGLLCDLLWSNPSDDVKGWEELPESVSYEFGPDVVKKFLEKHNMDLICRAHQVVEKGYEYFADRRLVTIFSAPDFAGEFDNAGAMMVVAENLTCSFLVLPSETVRTNEQGGINLPSAHSTSSTNATEAEACPKSVKWADLGDFTSTKEI